MGHDQRSALCLARYRASACGRSAIVRLGGRDQSDGLHLGLLGDRQRIVNLDSKVSDGALKLAVAEQKLYRPQVSGPPVYQSWFGERAGTVAVRSTVQRGSGWVLGLPSLSPARIAV